jgi:8-oxo-dGTP pyrophosphatase MutT (NUDIX family)
MSFLDHIDANNQHDPERYRPFTVDGARLGRVRAEISEACRRWPEIFEVGPEGTLALSSDLAGFEARTRAIADVLPALVEQGLLSRIKGEPYGVTATTPERACFVIDRAAAAVFGVRTFGQHLNGYVCRDGQLHMWIARRALDRINFPGKLDNLTAGGVPYGITLKANLTKECKEEASIPAQWAERAKPVGAVTYLKDSDWGLKPDTLYCYDLELPAGFEPQGLDGEADSFRLLPIEEVAALVDETDEFKPNVNLVIIDFLIRHGYLGPERADYLALVQGLRARL